MWVRNKTYQPAHLSELMKQRRVFEYWAHAAAILPIQDYRFSIPLKRQFRIRKVFDDIVPQKLLNEVKARIKSEGPLASRQFENCRKPRGGWWDWKPAKKALEKLFLEGDLEVTRRDGFQKVYDLPDRVVPKFSEIRAPSDSEYAWYLIERNLQHHGIAQEAEIGYLRRGPVKKLIASEIQNRLENKELVPLSIEGLEGVYLAKPQMLESPTRLLRKTQILSPFDNSVIQRQKLIDLFDFDYQIECYVPAAKRRFGYFTLPVLIGERFWGRIDLKAERKQRVLRVISVHPERGIKKKEFVAKLNKPLVEFAQFNGCDQVQFQ